MNKQKPADWLPPHLRKPRLRRAEASEYLLHAHGLPVAVATLAKWATIGGGPGFQKAGATPLYPREELDRWAMERLGKLVRSTSEVRA
ncbi:MAG: DNA-binding protein [Acetobacteraceae bacterium]|nr:DNA-binding protein [Acetobacteraceae bacterium]